MRDLGGEGHRHDILARAEVLAHFTPAELALPASPDTVARPVSPERLARLRAMPYREYLKTLEWELTRTAALRLAGYRCQLDAAHDSERLDVHHSSYERRGAELKCDVVVLCSECHTRHHGHGHGAEQPITADDPGSVKRTSVFARLFK